jgi:hypothetical protein
MSIVHESTHAIADELGRTHKGVDEEAAAYVAEALYNIYSGSPFTAGTLISAAAHNAANTIWGKPGYAIDPTQMAPLRAAILKSPAYKNLKTHPNYDNSDGVKL